MTVDRGSWRTIEIRCCFWPTFSLSRWWLASCSSSRTRSHASSIRRLETWTSPLSSKRIVSDLVTSWLASSLTCSSLYTRLSLSASMDKASLKLRTSQESSRACFRIWCLLATTMWCTKTSRTCLSAQNGPSWLTRWPLWSRKLWSPSSSTSIWQMLDCNAVLKKTCRRLSKSARSSTKNWRRRLPKTGRRDLSGKMSMTEVRTQKKRKPGLKPRKRPKPKPRRPPKVVAHDQLF